MVDVVLAVQCFSTKKSNIYTKKRKNVGVSYTIRAFFRFSNAFIGFGVKKNIGIPIWNTLSDTGKRILINTLVSVHTTIYFFFLFCRGKGQRRERERETILDFFFVIVKGKNREKYGKESEEIIHSF